MNGWTGNLRLHRKVASQKQTSLWAKAQDFLPFLGRQTLVSSGNQNRSLNLWKVSSFREHSSWRAQKGQGEAGTNGQEDEGLDTTTSVSTSPVPALDDRLATKSLDLTLELIFSLLKTPRTDLNQLRDSHNNGYNSPNTKLKLLSPREKYLIGG